MATTFREQVTRRRAEQLGIHNIGINTMNWRTKRLVASGVLNVDPYTVGGTISMSPSGTGSYNIQDPLHLNK